MQDSDIDPFTDPNDELIALRQFPEKVQLPDDPKTINAWIDRVGFPKPYNFGLPYKRFSLKQIRQWQRSRRAA
jgi:predicted DNA-binding transcriptional regulator AlpA